MMEAVCILLQDSCNFSIHRSLGKAARITEGITVGYRRKDSVFKTHILSKSFETFEFQNNDKSLNDVSNFTKIDKVLN